MANWNFYDTIVWFFKCSRLNFRFWFSQMQQWMNWWRRIYWIRNCIFTLVASWSLSGWTPLACPGDFHRRTRPKDKTYLINLFVYYETAVHLRLKWTRKSFKRWNKNAKRNIRSTKSKSVREKHWRLAIRNVKWKCNASRQIKRRNSCEKFATTARCISSKGLSRCAASIAKWLCCSIQIENMKTISKVLKIFSSFASLLFGVRAAFPSSRGCRRFSSWFSSLRRMHAVCYHDFNLFIFEYFACCHVNVRKHTVNTRRGSGSCASRLSLGTPGQKRERNLYIFNAFNLHASWSMRSSTAEWMDECTEVAEGAIGIAVVSQSRRGCVCARAARIKLVLCITFYHLLDVM